jgi:excisionase family DNA binding protein
MYVNVQRAARRLGVSPVTIRRWTSTGFLPCTRTPGGHRRIATEDIDELARSIGDGNHLTVRLARERELETIISTSISLSSRLEMPALLAEIAGQLTRLLECHACAISEYEPAGDSLRLLADYDATGRMLPYTGPWALSDYPLTRQVMDEQTTAVVYVDDPAADPAEVAILRHEGARTLLMVPLVYQERTIGLVEVQDRERRRRFSRQELRLARAVAGHAAVTLVNARMFERIRGADELLPRAAATLAAAVPRIAAAATLAAALELTAEAACEAFGAISCVAAARGMRAGATGCRAQPAGEHAGAENRREASVLLGGGEALSLTLTLTREPPGGTAELLELLAAAAAPLVARLR